MDISSKESNDKNNIKSDNQRRDLIVPGFVLGFIGLVPVLGLIPAVLSLIFLTKEVPNNKKNKMITIGYICDIFGIIMSIFLAVALGFYLVNKNSCEGEFCDNSDHILDESLVEVDDDTEDFIEDESDTAEDYQNPDESVIDADEVEMIDIDIKICLQNQGIFESKIETLNDEELVKYNECKVKVLEDEEEPFEEDMGVEELVF